MTKIAQRLALWPKLIEFHYKRLRYRIQRGTLFHGTPLPRLMHPLFYVDSLHWMQLGKYYQYRARPVKYDLFPEIDLSGGCPTMAIVTPSYNQAAYLEQTIKSVLDQGYPSLSYAVVDGGSKDGSADIIERYRSRLAFAISGPDNGQSDAIVKGMNAIDGEIQAYLNSDDVLCPGTLAYVGQYFAGHPDVDAVYGHRIIINEKSEEIGRWILPAHCPEATKYFDYIPQETLFWRREISEKVGGIDPGFHFAMDWDFILRMQSAGAKIVRLPRFLSCFRAHEAQKSQVWTEIGRREIDGLVRREGGEPGFNPRYDSLHWRFRKASLWTSLQLALGIRK